MMCIMVIEESCLFAVAMICKLIISVSERGKEIFYMIEAAVRLPSNASFKMRSFPGVIGPNRGRDIYIKLANDSKHCIFKR